MSPAEDRPPFPDYARALRDAGVSWPVLVLDRDRLDANAAAIADVARPGVSLRVVAKSLPVPQLLSRILTAIGSQRLMTFSVAMLEQLEQSLPGCDHLFGKPVPAAAVASLLRREDSAHALVERVVWLVDTARRIAQFADLAEEHGITLRVAVELDVGLHRGGVAGADAAAAFGQIADTANLECVGMMGYEPHLPALPSAVGVRARAEQAMRTAYADAVASARSVFGSAWIEGAIINTAGSKTLAQRADEDLCNDVSVGSLFVKPLDFASVDSPPTRPALFIATPVLKIADPLLIPGFGSTPVVQRALAGGARRGVYIHGGHWLAKPVHPAGLGYSGVIGRSSNQELLVTRDELTVDVDDYVFLQPTQSEAVMLQFGPIMVVSGDQVVESWPPFAPTA